MAEDKEHYILIDVIKVIACLAVLFYHFGILAGGFLAVCTFFVLSGYLAVLSASRKEKFSLVNYYKSRLLKIYLPLIIVVFVTFSVISLIPDVSWLSMKNETTSVIAGYNNFWQLSANQDYFARHINSPYVHLWYISILLQFELVFPFIYLFLKKIGDKTSKVVPVIISAICALASIIYFYITSTKVDLMITYYSTFTRLFSILFGITLGFIHINLRALVPNKIREKETLSKIIFYLYTILLIILCIITKSTSNYFAIAMIIATLISCRMIDYATIDFHEREGKFSKVIKSIAKVSYEIYLFQYPIIYIFQYLAISSNIKILIEIILILIFSYFTYFCIWITVEKKSIKVLKIIWALILTEIVFYGIYSYIIAPDYTEEMKLLKQQLEQNEKIMQARKQEFEDRLKQEKTEYLNSLQEFDDGVDKLKEIVPRLNLTGIGDSIMLGAVTNLYNKFPNAYIDAAVSRTAWVANGILSDLLNRGILGNPVVFNLGANGDCPKDNKIKILELCGDRKIFWINVTNDRDVNVNTELEELAQEYENLYIIDWNSKSNGHPEYFVADKIHLTEEGRQVYADFIYDSIYEVYLNDYLKQREEFIKQHEEEAKNKITFYGNDLLTKVYDFINEDFDQANFVINKEYDINILKQDIQRAIDENIITNKIVFALDKTCNLTSKNYEELENLCKGHTLYIIKTTRDEIPSSENVNIIDYYSLIQENNNYLMADKIHLTDEGNIALSKIMIENIIEEDDNG